MLREPEDGVLLGIGGDEVVVRAGVVALLEVAEELGGDGDVLEVVAGVVGVGVVVAGDPHEVDFGLAVLVVPQGDGHC